LILNTTLAFNAVSLQSKQISRTVMRSHLLKASTIALATTLSNCAALPSLPSDTEFPINEILRYSACELQSAYEELNERKYSNFDAGQFGIAIALQPKVDAEYTAKAGLTGKSNLKNVFFNSWAAGGATGGGGPGGGVDARGHQDGKATYNIKSSQFFEKKRLSLDCEHWSVAQPALVRNLQIRKWLLDSTDAAVAGNLQRLTGVDSESFTAEIWIKYDVGGAFTYNFPLGTDFASASGQYTIDDFLTITITSIAKEKQLKVVSLPSGGVVPGTKEPLWPASGATIGTGQSTSTLSPETRTRLDLLQLQQSIQNLQVVVPK
jgi:hypothetical protein